MKSTPLAILMGVCLGTIVALMVNQRLPGPLAKGEPTRLTTHPQLPDFVELAKALNPTVVNIVAYRKSQRRVSVFDHPFFNRPPRLEHGTGSGVFVDDKGHIVTNHHVISEADKIIVTLQNGTRLEGTLVGQDIRSDLAVIKVNPPNDFSYATFAEELPQVGSWVMAIGSPLGLDQTVTKGIVSAIGRRQVQVNQSVFSYANFIQTDAAINPGNSGGPLFNLEGKIVGINSAIASETGGFQGIGLAIPAALTKRIVKDLIRHGRIPYPWMGAVLANFDELTDAYLKKLDVSTGEGGVALLETWDKTPAHNSGLRADDVILSIDDQKVHSTSSLRYMLSQKRPGDTLHCKVWRQKKLIEISLQLEERPERVRDSIYYQNTRKVVD